MKNPNPPTMRDATPDRLLGGSVAEGVHNHGFETTSIENSQKVVRAFGRDNSGEAGTAQDERVGERTMGGGITNVAHSLGGATGKPHGGRS